jgi:ligand-binding sensor domain-containing protein
VVPLLEGHGLKRSTRTFDPASDSLFCLLFETAAPDSFNAINEVLGADPAWKEGLHSLAERIGVEADSLRYRFGLFETPAGPGTTVTVGAGFSQGLWQGFGARDGLPGSGVAAIIEDRDGYLWFGGKGLSRFDGQTFKTTAADGLPFKDVLALAEDREGHLWLSAGNRYSGKGSGVAYYDRQRFRIFTTEDGLAHDMVWDILEDQDGLVWFATENGVNRYDGQTFTYFTTKDGLPHQKVYDIFADRHGVLWFGTKGGVCRYEGEVGRVSKKETASFIAFTTKEGLADNFTSSIAEDHDGNLWFGTENGVSCLRWQDVHQLHY